MPLTLQQKVEAFLKTEEGKAKVNNYLKSGYKGTGNVLRTSTVSGAINGSGAGNAGGAPNPNDDISLLYGYIITEASHSVSPAVLEVIKNSGWEETVSFDDSTGNWIIHLYTTSGTRQSLAPNYFPGEISIIDLYNNGVDHIMHAVRGEWHGKDIISNTYITYTGFIESAIKAAINDPKSNIIKGEYHKPN